MPSTISQKLRIKDNYRLLTIQAPSTFKASLEPIPAGVKISSSLKSFDQVHWFVGNRKEMEAGLKQVLSLLTGDVVCWIYYPKGSSGVQTDLTRDKGWDKLLSQDLQWLNLISFDDTWSAFAMRQKTEADRKKEQQPKAGKPVDEYIDPVKKTVRIPDDLAKAFRKHRTAASWFDSLAYSHRKEYVEWIVSAKKEETREKRVQGTIEKLEQNWKNPTTR